LYAAASVIEKNISCLFCFHQNSGKR
jgi:hypothetical protein